MKKMALSQAGKVMKAVTIALMLAYPCVANAMPAAALLSPEKRCPKDVPLTDELLASIFETSVDVLNQFKLARSYTNELICTVSPSQLQRSIGKFAAPPRPDSPQEWAKFRSLQQRDESGTVKPDGLSAGLAQRKQIVSRIQPTAGISQSGWTASGPGNVGGRIRAAAIHPTNANIIFIGSVSGGIWKTTNGGGSWAPVADFMGNLSVSSIVFDPTDVTGNTLYAGTGEGFFNGDSVRGAGVFKSTDGGTTWSQLPSTNNSNWYYVNRLAMNSSGVLLAAAGQGSQGIYRSTDGGASWTLKASGRYLDVRFDPNDPAKAVAGGGSGGLVAYSSDAGATWVTTAISGGGRVELAYAKANSGVVYASVDKSSGEVFKSTDGGATWMSYVTPAHLGNQGWYANTIWVDPTDSTHLLVGGLDIYRITGATPAATKISTWYYSPASAHADQHIIFSDPGYDGAGNKRVYFGNDGGIQKTEDVAAANSNGSGNGWTNLNNGLAITQFYSGAGNSTINRIIGGTQDNGSLMTTGSTSWTTFFGGDGGFSAVDPVDGNYLYGEYVYLQLHRNSSGGASQSSYIYSGISDAGSGSTANFIAPFILDPNNSSRMLAGGQSLWVSGNVKAGTPSWSKMVDRSGVGSDYVSAIAIAESDSTKIWYGTNSGGLYYSLDNGASFPQLVLGTPGRMVLRILVDKTNPFLVYVSYGGYSSNNLYKLISTNSGVTWTATNITGNLPAVPIRGLARHPTNANWLYAGTEVGIFNSTDGGSNWFATNDGPANVSVEELFWYDNSTLVAATHGRGMFKTTVDTTNPGDTISVTSTKTNGRYKSGEVVDIQVQFTKAVNVTGTPRLALNSGGYADYLSGDGTNTLTFRYTVGASDTAADLDYSASGSLTLNGGTIVDKTTKDAASLTLATPGATGSLGYAKNLVIDNAAPSIVGVSIPNAAMNIGDIVTATITVASDSDIGYSLKAGSTVGSFTLGNLTRTSSTSYTATFTVSNGGTDVAAGANVPVNVVLTDGAGNDSTAYTTAISQNADAIDANKPVISAVSIPNATMKVGDVVTATLTVASDADTYTLKAGATIGGFALGSLSKTNNTTYTATFTVTEGGTDVASGADIPVSLTLIDTAGNESAAYATAIAQNGDAIDANTPAAPTITGATVNGLGGTVTITAPPTGITAWLAPAGTSVFAVGPTMTRLVGNGSSTAIATPTNGGVYKLYWVDAAGNISSASSNALTVDATGPTITGISIPNVAMKVGSTVTATITVVSDPDTGYTLKAGSVIGGFTLGSLTRISNTSYTATFTVSNGGTDVAAGANVPVNVILTDGAGNDSTAYTTAISQNADAIDANKPVISAVSIPNATMKVGDVVTATLTVASDADTYTLKAGATIGGFALGSLSKTNATTYTATFTVTEGGTDVASGADIPVSLTLIDTAGNESAAYTTAIAQNGDAIDANSPATPIISTSTVNGLGGTITITAPPTGITAWLAPAGTSVFAVGPTMTRLVGNGSSTAIVTPTSGGAYKLYWVDAAGNISSASNNALTVDAVAPTTTLSSVIFDPATNTLTFTGAQMNSLLESGENSATDIKARLDWSKLAWDVDGNGSLDKTFVLGDIASVTVPMATSLVITLTPASVNALKALTGYGAIGGADKVVVTSGFLKDLAGNPATTDAFNGVVAIKPVVSLQPAEWLAADGYTKAGAATALLKFTLQSDGGQTLDSISVTISGIIGGLQAGDIESLVLAKVGSGNALTLIGSAQTSVAISGSATTILAGTQDLSTATTFAVVANIKATAPTHGAGFRLDMAGNGVALSADSPTVTALTSQHRLNIDTVAPSVASVGVSGASTTTATLAATLNEAGTGYWVVLPDTANAPSATQIKNGQDDSGNAVALKGNVAMASGIATQFSLTGLTQNTSYKAYLVATDLAGNDIAAVEAVAFATTAPVVVVGNTGGGTSTSTTSTTTVAPGGTFTIGNSTTPVEAGEGSTLTVTDGTSGATINLPTPSTGSDTSKPVTFKIGGMDMGVKPLDSGSVVKTATVKVNGADTTVLTVTAGKAEMKASGTNQPLMALGSGDNAVVVSSSGADAKVTASVDKTTGVTSLTLAA
ncbi:MAG: hypothetical protein KGZ83_03010, partial [Sulfuricella sp.]|nr:hypothetical protein [Sulfuricella sp.]